MGHERQTQELNKAAASIAVDKLNDLLRAYSMLRLAVGRIDINHEAIRYNFPDDMIPGLSEDILTANKAVKLARQLVGDIRSHEELVAKLGQVDEAGYDDKGGVMSEDGIETRILDEAGYDDKGGVMSEDGIETRILDGVAIRQNGIIRGPDGFIIGRLADSIEFEGEHIAGVCVGGEVEKPRLMHLVTDFKQVQSKYSAFGALDTEPQAVFTRAMATFISSGALPDIEAGSWGLFCDKEGYLEAGQEISNALHLLCSKLSEDSYSYVRELDEYFGWSRA